MKYIIRLSEPFNDIIEETLINHKITISHIDTVLDDLLIVKTTSIELLENLPFIRKISKARIGKLQQYPFKIQNNDFKIDILPSLNEKRIHKKGLVGFGTNILILDSGYNGNSNLKFAMTKNFTEDEDMYDRINHGTLVAAIINKIAPASNLYLGKICSHDPNNIDEEFVFRGLNWATELPNINIINLSIGLDFNCKGDCDLAEKVNKMVDLGYTIISAAGNQNNIHCPACAENGIAVGSLTAQGNKVANSSSVGLPGTTKPDLLAQGSIMEYYLRKTRLHTGTSFSCPIITGILGATFSHIKEGTPPKIALFYSCEELEQHTINQQGFGVLNLDTYLKGLRL